LTPGLSDSSGNPAADENSAQPTMPWAFETPETAASILPPDEADAVAAVIMMAQASSNELQFGVFIAVFPLGWLIIDLTRLASALWR
jgi:hypothetical protein